MRFILILGVMFCLKASSVGADFHWRQAFKDDLSQRQIKLLLDLKRQVEKNSKEIEKLQKSLSLKK